MTRIGNAERLKVLEYGGTGRSGKGTIVGHLAENHKGVSSDETGADYRAVTRHLLARGIIRTTMSPEEISDRTRDVGVEGLAKIVADRKRIVAEHTFESLYEDDVSRTVHSVSREPRTRTAVKTGFSWRLEGFRDDDDTKVLVVDGRNLESVIEKIEGVDLIMRTFVHCTPEEAALRECARNDVDLGTDRGRAVYEEAQERIRARNEADASRDMDPVRVNPDALDFWRLRDSAVGAMACATGQQIDFDTTSFRVRYPQNPREAMLEAADEMFHDALTAAGAPLDSLH